MDRDGRVTGEPGNICTPFPRVRPTRKAAITANSQNSHRVVSYRIRVSNSLEGQIAPQHRRHSPRRRNRSHGVAGNARLTASIAVVLFVLLAAEGFTILKIGPLLKAHVFIGMLLVPPVILKISSTFYRFVRYYLNDPSYRHKGPPPMVLRMLGPALVVITVVLFATGIAMLYLKGSSLQTMLFLHKASFVLWFCGMTIHVLGHISETARLAPRDFVLRSRHKVRGANARNAALLVSLVIGVVLGAALIGRVPEVFLHLFGGR